MIPIEFEQCNTVYAKDQPEYQPLPAYKSPSGTVVSCWELTEEDIQRIIRTRKLYISMLTFNQPLQPILPTTENPIGEQE